MRHHTALPAARIASAAVIALLGATMPVQAGVRVLASDARGVTLRVDVGDFRLAPSGVPGRLAIEGAGLDVAGAPGRPRLPLASVTVAVPPGARAVARVVEGATEQAQAARLEIVALPGFRYEPGDLGYVPTLTEVAPPEGPWPASPVEIGEPFYVRRVQAVHVRVRPFRYDETTGTLWTRDHLTVRVDFEGGATGAFAPESDPHWDPVLREAFVNADRATGWREPAARARPLTERLEAMGAGRGAGVTSARRALAPAAPGFDENEPEVRVQLDTTGVYALEYDRLAARGFPAAVPDSEVSVHRHEFVEGASPPYATIELPIEVDDRDGDGVFGPGDRILVWVQSWAERSRASMAQRAWGDGEVVYATRVRGRPGLRMTQRAGWLDLALSPLQSYPWTQHWEQNNYYMAAYSFSTTDADTNVDQFHWNEILLFALRDSFPFQVYDIDTTHRAAFTITWQGRRQDTHLTWCDIRNGNRQFTSIADSSGWVGRGSRSVTADLFGSAFTNGRNVMRTWGKTSDQQPDAVNVALNWFETRYWRAFRTLNGRLPCNSGDAAGPFQIDASNFPTSDIRVYDVSDSLNPVRLALDDTLVTRVGLRWTVRFQDDATGGARRQYVVFDTPRTLAPERYGAVPYPRRALYARGAGDYLMVVPEVFAAAAEPLAAFREGQGLAVVRAPVETVYDEFNGGRRSSYALRRFFRYGLDNWNTAFAVLVGDGSEDPQNLLGTSGIDWIPAQKIPGPVPVSDGASSIYEPIPSDTWLVWCLDCPNWGSAQRLPDIFLGRLPVNSAEETAGVVEKLIANEQVDPTGANETWRREMFILADDKYSTTSFFGGGNPGGPAYCRKSYEGVFRTISDLCAAMVVDSAGLRQSNAEVFDLHVELRNEPTFISGSDTCRVSWTETQSRAHLTVTPKILQRLNAGRLWWNFQGHANQYVLSHEDIWVNRGANDDHVFLVNEGRPFFFSAFSCHPNGFAVTRERTSSRGPSIGEEIVTMPRAGAIASWASTGFEILPSNPTTHLNVHLARALFHRPPSDPYLGERGARVVLGEAIALALVNNAAAVSFSLERDVGISYCLLGDPASRLWIGPTQFTVTANGQPVTNGESVRLASVGDSLTLVADIASNVALSSVTLERTAGSTVVVPPADYTLSPAVPDTTPSAFGGRRTLLTYRTTLDVGSYHYTIRAVDRYGVSSAFDVVFEFLTTLRLSGVPLVKDDAVPPTAELSMLVVSPGTLTPGDFQLAVDGLDQVVTATAVDTTSRRWVLTWNHAPYAVGGHTASLTVGAVTVGHEFRVDDRLRFERAMAFPNPFEDDLGTTFSFSLIGAGPADVMLRVYTVTGRLVYERVERGMLPVYHQLAWNGRDAEGQKLGNGVYLYRLIAHDASGSVVHEGRLVKLRKPRRAPEAQP